MTTDASTADGLSNASRRRSSALRYVSAISSFDCSKMRPDAFGGMAVLITADRILGKSTNDLLAEFLAEAGLEA